VKIGIVEPFGQSGIGQYAYLMAQALSETGSDVLLYTRVPHELEVMPRSFSVVGAFRSWDPHSMERHAATGLGRAARKVAHGLIFSGDMLRVAGHLRRDRPDVVHFHEVVLAPELRLLRWLRAQGFVLWDTVHSVRPFDLKAGSADVVSWGRGTRRFYGRVYDCFHGVILPNEAAAKQFGASYPGYDGRLEILPHPSWSALAPETLPEACVAQRELGLQGRGSLLLYFGIVRKYKGVDTLLEAFRILRARDISATLVIAGYPHRDCPPQRLIDTIREKGLQDDVVLELRYIPLPRLSLYLAAARAVVIPFAEIYESASVPLAQAHGRPVVTTTVGDMDRRIDSGRDGLLVPSGNAEALADAMERVATDADLAARLGAEARGRVLAGFSWGEAARRLLELYETSSTAHSSSGLSRQ
jgi:glycosyltransferase involved in cell wall biosynthesis